MTHALVAISDATYGGVYYCSAFTTGGAQPVFTKLTTTGLPSLEPDIFRVDYADPLNIQYLGYDCLNTDSIGAGYGSIYRRRGGDWVKIMDVTMAQAYVPAAEYVTWLWTDPGYPGRIYTLVWYNGSGINPDPGYVLYSDDYGDTWTAKYISTESGFNGIEAHGDYIWVGATKQVLPKMLICGSDDRGASWSIAQVTSSLAVPSLRANPLTPSKCIVWTASATIYCTITAGVVSSVATTLPSSGTTYTDYVAFDPAVSGRAISFVSDDLYYTDDDLATVSNVDTDVTGHAITRFYNEAGTDYAGGAGSTLYWFDSPTDQTGTARSGANHGSAPYADSLPGVGTIVQYGIWVGTAPAQKGVYVYSLEMESGDSNWSTDLADYTNIGSPMGGDRSSFRDMPADGFDVYHAEDVHAGTPQIHAPWDSASPPGAGYGIVSDGTKWEVSSGPLATTGLLHNAVTLDADAATILDLNVQEIGLDVQNANTVLAGPTTGAANEPTFRALVTADLPAIALNDLSDVDTTGVVTNDIIKYNGVSWVDGRQALDDLSDVNTTGVTTGDVIYKSSGDWVDYPLGIATYVQNNGTYLRFGTPSSGYIEIDLATGELRLQGTATQFDDLRVSASIAKPGVTAPGYKAFGPSGNLQALMFEAGHHDEVYFEVQMPHNWKEGSDIYPHVHWSPVNATAGNVVWELEYTWANINGTFGAPGNMASDATAAGGTAWVHKLTALKESGNSYIDGAGKTLSSMLVCRLHRNSNSGSDTLNQDVALLEVDFHYEINSFGSFTEYGKEMNDLLLEDGDALLLEDSFLLGLE